MKFLLVAIVIGSSVLLGAPAAFLATPVAFLATPASAHVVQAVSSFSIADLDVDDRPQLEGALKAAIDKVLKDTIAFEPTFVALTDAQIIGSRVYFKVLIADEDGEQTLTDLTDHERGEPEPPKSQVKITL